VAGEVTGKGSNTFRRGSAVGIVTGYGLDGWGVGVRVPLGSRIFISPYRPDRFWGPPNLLSNVYGGSFPGGKAPGQWSLHSPPTGTEVKKHWYTHPLTMRLHGLISSAQGQIYVLQLIYVQDGGEWSASRFSHFASDKKYLATNWSPEPVLARLLPLSGIEHLWSRNLVTKSTGLYGSSFRITV
jgi:hypothetical protein